jgi:hypothetical protein
MSTRKRTNPTAAQPQPEALKPGTVDADHLPPQRPRKRVSKQVRPPLADVSLTTFIYVLVGLAAVYLLSQAALTAKWSILGHSETSTTAKMATQGKDQIKDRLQEFASSRAANSGAAQVCFLLPHVHVDVVSDNGNRRRMAQARVL